MTHGDITFHPTSYPGPFVRGCAKIYMAAKTKWFPTPHKLSWVYWLSELHKDWKDTSIRPAVWLGEAKLPAARGQSCKAKTRVCCSALSLRSLFRVHWVGFLFTKSVGSAQSFPRLHTNLRFPHATVHLAWYPGSISRNMGQVTTKNFWLVKTFAI